MDNSDDDLVRFYKNLFIIFENDSNTWLRNNPHTDKLEIALKVVELEVAKISVEHSILTNLIEERLKNTKLPVYYTSLLGTETKREINVKNYSLSKLSILDSSYNRQLNSLNYYENINRLKDLSNSQ